MLNISAPLNKLIVQRHSGNLSFIFSCLEFNLKVGMILETVRMLERSESILKNADAITSLVSHIIKYYR